MWELPCRPPESMTMRCPFINFHTGFLSRTPPDSLCSSWVLLAKKRIDCILVPHLSFKVCVVQGWLPPRALSSQEGRAQVWYWGKQTVPFLPKIEMKRIWPSAKRESDPWVTVRWSPFLVFVMKGPWWLRGSSLHSKSVFSQSQRHVRTVCIALVGWHGGWPLRGLGLASSPQWMYAAQKLDSVSTSEYSHVSRVGPWSLLCLK